MQTTLTIHIFVPKADSPCLYSHQISSKHDSYYPVLVTHIYHKLLGVCVIVVAVCCEVVVCAGEKEGEMTDNLPPNTVDHKPTTTERNGDDYHFIFGYFSRQPFFVLTLLPSPLFAKIIAPNYKMMRSHRLVSSINVVSATSCLRRSRPTSSSSSPSSSMRSTYPIQAASTYQMLNQRMLHTTTTMRAEVGGTDAEWDELLATSEIEIVTAQRLTPEEKLNQQRTDEFIDKLLSVPSGQLVKDMLYSAISTHKTLQEKHLFEVLKRAKRQLGELQRTMPDGVVSVSNVAVYPPARAYLIFEASLDAGLIKMMCERERVPDETSMEGGREQSATAQMKGLEEESPSGLSADEEQLFAMLLARKNASLNRQRTDGVTPATVVSPPTPVASIEDVNAEVVDLDEDEAPPTVEDTLRTNVLVRVSKIADTVLKLLLAPAIRNIQDEDRGGSSSSSGKVKLAASKSQSSDPTTPPSSSPVQTINSSPQQAEEDAAMAWRLLALMERKGLRVSSPKILSALKDFAHCGVEGDNGGTGGGGDNQQQQHVVTSQRLQFLEHEERRIQRDLRRGIVSQSSEDRSSSPSPSAGNHASPHPEAVPRRR